MTSVILTLHNSLDIQQYTFRILHASLIKPNNEIFASCHYPEIRPKRISIILINRTMKKQSDKNLLENTSPVVTIFCKNWCNYQRELVNLLRVEGWPFTFINLNFDAEKAQELVPVLGKFFLLPVLKINGRYYEKPPLSEVVGLLKNQLVE